MSIYKKLFEAKKEIGKISKDSKNPFYKSKYFDINQLLEHVEPILQLNDLLVIQPIKDNKVYSIIIDVETGEKEESYLDLTDQKDPQKKGSEITYYRRYTLASLLGLQAKDDDGNSAIPKPVTKPIEIDKIKNRLESCKDIEQLAAVYKSLTVLEQKASASIKDDMKIKLTKK